jgi:hypothetical protein
LLSRALEIPVVAGFDAPRACLLHRRGANSTISDLHLGLSR